MFRGFQAFKPGGLIYRRPLKCIDMCSDRFLQNRRAVESCRKREQP